MKILSILLILVSISVYAIQERLSEIYGVDTTTVELNELHNSNVTGADLNKLRQVTATYTELNIMDGVLSSTAELNKLNGATATTAEINKLHDIVSPSRYSSSNLGSLISVTSACDTMQNIHSITLPSAGYYEIKAVIHPSLSGTSPQGYVQLYDGSSYVSGTGMYVYAENPIYLSAYGNFSGTLYIRGCVQSGTFIVAYTGATGGRPRQTYMSYIRLF